MDGAEGATATAELQSDEHSTRCPDCGKSWTYPVVVLGGGRTVPAREEERICPDCIAQEEAEQRQREEAEEQQRRQRQAKSRGDRIHELMAAAGGNPWEHGHCSFENFDVSDCGEEPREATIEFVEATKAAGPYDPVKGLYLWGGTGSGKTHLAMAAFASFLRDEGFEPRDVVFDHALDLITRIQDTYNTGASALELIDRRINARVWILDDLGSEQASPDVVRRLTLILTRRALRPTLITGNFDPDTYEDRHEELFRIGSRLGPRYFRAAQVDGNDRRYD